MLRITAAFLCAIGALSAQAPRPAFEEASIKPNASGSGSSSSNSSKGQIVFTNVSLKRLVERAYNVKPFQVIAPSWTEDLKFDIRAKIPPDTDRDAYPLMLRALLEDRFGLAVHKDSKDVAGYALVVAKGGAKLKPSETNSGASTSTNSNNLLLTLTAKSTSMEVLADLIARNLSEMVVDKTGLPGAYDFELKWSRESANVATDGEPAPSIFTALQESLGLRLQAQKVPVEIIVVDRVERTPTEN